MQDFDTNLLVKIIDFAWIVLAAPVMFLWSQIEKIKREQSKMKDSYYETSLHAANTYVKQADYRQDLTAIHADIKAVDKKLDHVTELLSKKVDRV